MYPWTKPTSSCSAFMIAGTSWPSIPISARIRCVYTGLAPIHWSIGSVPRSSAEMSAEASVGLPAGPPSIPASM